MMAPKSRSMAKTDTIHAVAQEFLRRGVQQIRPFSHLTRLARLTHKVRVSWSTATLRQSSNRGISHAVQILGSSYTGPLISLAKPTGLLGSP